MKALFVVWQDPDTRTWIPVARLTREDGTFRFAYTKGALESSKFIGFGRMTDMKTVYESRELFPLFANRILPKSRPEYRQYLEWLGLDEQRADELEVLARSGGLRATDTLEIIPCPEPTSDHRYVVYFFAHGQRYLSAKDQDRVLSLKSSDRLYLMRDVQNHIDSNALLLRTGDPISVIGYCPRYYSAEFSQLLVKAPVDQVRVMVEKVNPDAPSHYRLMCRLSAPWPHGFEPCARDAFEPVVPVLA
jgi:hypothetical protein